MKVPHFFRLFRPQEFFSFKNGEDKPEFWFTEISVKFLKFLGWVLVGRFFFILATTDFSSTRVFVDILAIAAVYLTRAYVIKTQKHKTPLALFISAEFFCVFFMASLEGGMGSPVLYWLPVIPVVCFLMIPAMSFFAIGFSFIGLLTLNFSPTFFGLTATMDTPIVNDWKYFIDVLCPILSLACLAWLYEKKTWGLIEGIERAKEDLNIYKNAIEASSEGIVITNPRLEDNPIIYVNKAYEAITGYTFDESVGRNCRFLQVNHDADDINVLRNSIRKQESVTVTLENKKKSGEHFFNRLTISPVFDKNELHYFVGVQRDVTKELNISQIFEQSQRIANMDGFVFRPYADEVLWTSDKHSYGLYQSGKAAPFLEAFDFLKPNDIKFLRRSLEQSSKTKKAFEFKVESLDEYGHKVYYIIRGEPDQDERENVRIFGLVQDVTNLVHIQNKLETMVLTLTDIVLILDREGRYVEVICENENDLVAPKKEIIGKTATDFLGAKMGDIFHRLVVESIEHKKVTALDYDLEIDGEVRYFSAKIASTDGERAICTIKNVTEERETQLALEKEKRERAQRTKMTALGEMAGGIAHEINNPLTIISGHAYKLKKLLKNKESFDYEQAELYTTKVSETVNRISKIIKSMRRFSRDGSNDPMVGVNFQSILDDTIELCSQRFKSMDVILHIENQLQEGTEIFCREVEVGQVLLNLLNNAFDAIKEIQSEEEEIDVSKHWIRISCFEIDQDVVVKVSDSGAGVPEKSRSKLFEPFYTSKAAGVGTGLGLSISQNIMQQHNGDLWYEDNEENTSFAFRLKKVA